MPFNCDLNKATIRFKCSICWVGVIASTVTAVIGVIFGCVGGWMGPKNGVKLEGFMKIRRADGR